VGLRLYGGGVTTGLRIRTALSVALTVAVLASCGGSSSFDSATTASPGARSTPSALQFSAPVLGGSSLEGASLAGEAVMLWFWAPT
jgi:hypothetical protein